MMYKLTTQTSLDWDGKKKHYSSWTRKKVENKADDNAVEAKHAHHKKAVNFDSKFDLDDWDFGKDHWKFPDLSDFFKKLKAEKVDAKKPWSQHKKHAHRPDRDDDTDESPDTAGWKMHDHCEKCAVDAEPTETDWVC